MARTRPTYATRLRRLWLVAAAAGVGYGVFLIVAATGLPAGAPLTGLFGGQPVVKAAMALLLAGAAAYHPIRRERRWLVAALLCSASGDLLLALPGWPPSFLGGLGSFLLAHLCYLVVLVPLARRGAGRLAGAGVVVLACAGLLRWFWPYLGAAGMTAPVTVYLLVIAAMVCAALLAGLPTAWTAIGAVCFAVSDAMIGISEFVRADQLLAVPIWWAYAAAQLLITAGFFFGRTPSEMSGPPATTAT